MPNTQENLSVEQTTEETKSSCLATKNPVHHEVAASSTSSSLEDRVIFVTSALAFTWFLICTAATLWLMFTVPLQPTDIDHSSWLVSYTTTTHPSGILGTTVAVIAGIMGVAIGLAKQNFAPVVMGLGLSVAMILGSSESAIFRVLVAADQAKVGCYSYNSKECRDMLGVPAHNAPSMYQPAGRSGIGAYSDWYYGERQKWEVSPLLSVPGVAFLASPFYIFEVSKINAKLVTQREVVARFKASNIHSGVNALRHSHALSAPTSTSQ